MRSSFISAFFWPPSLPPPAIIPNVEMSIIIGIIIIIGLSFARWSMKTIIPSDATIMTPGRTF